MGKAGRIEHIIAAQNPPLSDYRIVHFATHAIIDDDNPGLSGLVLSQVDQQGKPIEDYYLWLNDIFNLNLNAELVVQFGWLINPQEFSRRSTLSTKRRTESSPSSPSSAKLDPCDLPLHFIRILVSTEANNQVKLAAW